MPSPKTPASTAAVASYRDGATATNLLQRELDRLASQLAADALVITDKDDRILASAGPRRAAWLPDTTVHSELEVPARRRLDEIVQRPSALFRASGVDVSAVNASLGYVYLTRAIDDGYAAELSTMMRTQVTISAGGDIVGSTHTPGVRSAFIRHASGCRSTG